MVLLELSRHPLTHLEKFSPAWKEMYMDLGESEGTIYGEAPSMESDFVPSFLCATHKAVGFAYSLMEVPREYVGNANLGYRLA